MFKIFYTSRRTEAGAPDPLDHPDILRMSQRELADLPLPRPKAQPPRDG